VYDPETDPAVMEEMALMVSESGDSTTTAGRAATEDSDDSELELEDYDVQIANFPKEKHASSVVDKVSLLCFIKGIDVEEFIAP